MDIETKVLGSAPPKESIQQRLEAIETKLFGVTHPGGLTFRIAVINEKLAEPTEPPSAATGSAVTAKPSQPAPTEWPQDLPRFATTAPKKSAPLKVGISQSTRLADKPTPASSKNVLSEQQAAGNADALMKKGDYASARNLFDKLAEEHPTNPAYFYGAGSAKERLADYHGGFADMIISWHLGGDQVRPAAESVTKAIKDGEDRSFHLNDYQAQDPASVLNAGVRLWTLGAVPEAAELFEYLLKNDPVAAPFAAYNLGAMYEYGGNLKAALAFYQWALSQRATMGISQTYPSQRFRNMATGAVDDGDIRGAISDVQTKMARNSKTWDGWIPNGPMKSGMICPACAIRRIGESAHTAIQTRMLEERRSPQFRYGRNIKQY